MTGSFHAFYLFDVAQAIDLSALARQIGPGAGAAAAWLDKSPGAARLQYTQPPLVLDESAGAADLDGFRLRSKWYEYGVISVMLSRPFSGAWEQFVEDGLALVERETLEARAAARVGQLVDRHRAALVAPRRRWLTEDYLVFVLHPQPALTAEGLLAAHGPALAQLLRGERQPLSVEERTDVLRHRFSYLEHDLVVPTWSAAFVYETEASLAATLEIVEFANSQLLEFRYHDDLLDTELAAIYAALQQPRWTDALVGRRHTRAARRLQSLFIDVNELTDRMENAVKLVGDIYSARLFSLVGARLGLDAWKRNVENKLETLDDIYRFAVEQTGMSQGNLLELVIVLILVLELGLLLAGIMR
jgi:hypothetical protein